MANAFTYQVLKDTTEHVVIKLTGKFDGSSGQESNVSRIQANTLYGALNANTPPTLLSVSGPAKPFYGLAVNRLWYDCTATGTVELFWNATDTPKTIFFLNGNLEYDAAGNWITIPNNAGANATGDIGIVTTGMVANSTYTILVELRKDNVYYQRGQFNDPAAFNYPPYNLKP